MESILFIQKLKNFKNCFGDSVASHPSRMLQPRARVLILATYSRVKGPVVRGIHFRGSARDSLAGRPSSREKHLKNFSQFCLWVFWRLAQATCWRLTSVAKNACSAFRRPFFPWIFVTIHYLPHFYLNWNWLKLHFYIISSQIFKKGCEFSLSHFIFHVLSLLFLFL